jgi:transcriptional regulator with XRE-family HTH domain
MVRLEGGAGSNGKPHGHPTPLRKETMDLSVSDLRHARLSSGLSQNKLGRLTGIKPSRLSEYEHGHIEPSLETLAKIGAALHAHLIFQRQNPAASEDAQLRAAQVKRLESMGTALSDFLAAHPSYADLVLPLTELLATARARVKITTS